MNELFSATITVITGTILLVTIGFNLFMVGLGSWHIRNGNYEQAQANSMIILNVDKWLVPAGAAAMLWWWAIQ